jgi:beta-glucanase (GH16 family)
MKKSWWRQSHRLTQLVIAVLLFLPFFLITHAWGQTAPVWHLIWSDEFNGAAGSAPNPANWTLTQGLTPDGAQSYNCLYGQSTNGCNPAAPNVYLDGNGNLAIVARAAAGAPNGMTTGRVSTSAGSNNQTILFGAQYGRIEAGMTLPAGSGNQGVWPAFWMLGTNISSVNWPSSGEMDIMEYIGAANETQIYSTLHGQAYANLGLGVRDTIAGGWSGYHIFGAIWSPNQVSFYVDNIDNIYGTISAADLMANQPWVNGGLSAWPFNNPMYLILDLNMGGPFPGNVSAATTYPQTLLVDYVRVYQASPPGPPTNVTATATSQSQVTLNWTESTNIDATYNVYRSSVSGVAPQSQAQPNAAQLPHTNQTLIANKITGTSYTDANLSPGQTYYYTVTSSGNYSGESAAQQAPVTLPTSGVGANGGAIYVSAGGYSSEGAYIKNSLVSGGFTNASTTTVNTNGIANPAPQNVYHTERWGPQTWTIAHLTPRGSYNVRMHFAETAFGAAGQRQFNVLINGQQVLTNFDIFAATGAKNTVVTQTINTLADQNGMILLQLTRGAADQPEIRALDVTPSTGGAALGIASGTATYVAINSGGPVEGAFEADADAGNLGLPSNPITAGGGTNATTQAISLSGVTNPAPQAVYETERYGAFGYIFTGLVANSTYAVRLHLAEGVANYHAAGLRQFNVLVNGKQVLTNYDIFANAGAVYQAVVPQVTGVSDEHGILSVQFTPGYDDLPSVRGIEITQFGTPPATTATPAFSPAAGTYSSAQTVAMSDATAGATIYYTTTGTTPTTASAVYSGPITVSATETLKAMATASGDANSAVATAAYTITPATTATTATPTFSPAAGTYSSAQSVAMSDATAGATIHYTTNGTTPTTASVVYSGPITVSATETLKAMATAAGDANSAVATAAYTTIATGGGGTDILDISAGGTAAAGSYAADEDFVGGTVSATAKTISTLGVTNPAPEAVYQHHRFGNFTYSLPGFTAGNTYLVRLHFDEFYWSAAGKRVFNVSINGTQVLTNFDVFAAAGGQNIAIVEQINAVANASGQIVIQFTTVTDNAEINGIEVETTSGVPAAPAPPTGLIATSASSSQINLSWTASTTAGVMYEVFSSTTPGFTPTSANLIATVSGTTYLNTGLAASTTHYYAVEATNSAGASTPTAPAVATTQSLGAAPTPPTALTATAASSSQINLTWTASTTAGVQYEVFQNGAVIAMISGTAYSSTGLIASTTYNYTVEATNSAGPSTPDGPVSATTLAGGTGTVAAPTSLTAVGSSSQQIDLRWVPSTTAAPDTAPVNYQVYRSTTPNFTPSAANLLGSIIGITNYVDSNYPATLTPPVGPGVQPATTYYYQVVASTSAGASAAAAASATSLPATPSTSAPAPLTGLTAMVEDANEIDLVWNSTNSKVGTVVTEYTIYRSTTPTFTPAAGNKIGTTKSNWFQDALCAASTQYYYQVLANNSLGASPTSTTVSATTPALNANRWGGKPFFDGSGLPAKQNVVMMKFLNRTNGKYTDDQIIWTAKINGVSSQFTIAQQPFFDMPANSSGRMYFYLNDPALAQNNTNYWDFIEFTVGPTSINMNTTRVDALGVKIAFNLTCSDGTNVALGENLQTFKEDRSVTFQRYANAVPSTPGGNFQSDLAHAPYRIIEPGAAGFNAGGADQNYYANYISNIWSYNGITIPQAGPNGSNLGGNPDLSAAIFRHTAPISGTPEFNAAGALTNQGMWGNPASFYQQEPYNHYAQWIDAQAINMQQYAFPYNDAGGYSSDIGCANPQTLLVTIGW